MNTPKSEKNKKWEGFIEELGQYIYLVEAPFKVGLMPQVRKKIIKFVRENPELFKEG